MMHGHTNIKFAARSFTLELSDDFYITYNNDFPLAVRLMADHVSYILLRTYFVANIYNKRYSYTRRVKKKTESLL
jgi:hypothetical protein